MKNFFFLLLLPALSFAQVKESSTATAKTAKTVNGKTPKSIPQPEVASGFTISGNVEGLTDGEVKITTTQGEQLIAKGVVKNGIFTVKGSVPEPALYWLTMSKEQPQYIFLENAPIKITGKKSSIKNLKIEGSQSHTDFLEFRMSFDPLFANLNAMALQLQQTPEDKKPALVQQYNEAVAAMNKAVSSFIAAKPSSYVSLFLMLVTRQITENIADLEQRFNLLNAALKTSAGGKELESYIAFAKVGAIGTEALEFTQNDVDNKPVSLSQFRGKYVLIDFWASWCKPCRLENPNVVKTYNKFKNKNFTVLGVSLDQQKEPWLKAIATDKLDWTHVSDLQFWNNAAAQLYHVQSIPQNFLIDPNGKIVAKDLRGEDLEKKLCEFIGCSN